MLLIVDTTKPLEFTKVVSWLLCFLWSYTKSLEEYATASKQYCYSYSYNTKNWFCYFHFSMANCSIYLFPLLCFTVCFQYYLPVWFNKCTLLLELYRTFRRLLQSSHTQIKFWVYVISDPTNHILTEKRTLLNFVWMHC